MSSLESSIRFIGDEATGHANIKSSGYTTTVLYPCVSSTICAPYSITFSPGCYFIELYGASGGNVTGASGGKGGKSSGVFKFSHRSIVFLFIGGSGKNHINANLPGGYNGGGSCNSYRASGGGATDIRLNENDLQSRLIVAGGGGGAHFNAGENPPCQIGGDGGGLEGKQGTSYGSAFPCYGSQTSCKGGNFNAFGFYGYGNNATISAEGGGGGGGFWGGGSARSSGSAGGSGYIGGALYSFSFKRETIAGINYGNGFALITNISNLLIYSKGCFESRFFFIVVVYVTNFGCFQ